MTITVSKDGSDHSQLVINNFSMPNTSSLNGWTNAGAGDTVNAAGFDDVGAITLEMDGILGSSQGSPYK